MDKKNEKEVQASIDAIRQKLGAVTTVVIAHRLSTIRNADKIIVLKKGKLTEVGNHDSLLREHPNGTYAKLVKQQQEAENGVQEQDNLEKAKMGDEGNVEEEVVGIGKTSNYLTGRNRSAIL